MILSFLLLAAASTTDHAVVSSDFGVAASSASSEAVICTLVRASDGGGMIVSKNGNRAMNIQDHLLEGERVVVDHGVVFIDVDGSVIAIRPGQEFTAAACRKSDPAQGS